MSLTKDSKCTVSLSAAFKVFELLSIISPHVSHGLIHPTPKPNYDFIPEFHGLLSVVITQIDAFGFCICMLTEMKN